MPEEFGTESLVKEFLEEASELFEVLDRDLLQTESDLHAGADTPRDRLDEMFRSMHTMKGLASMFDLVAIKDLAHAVENVFDRMRKEGMVADAWCLDLLLRSVDVLKQGVAAFEAGELDDAPVEAAAEEIRAYLAGAPAREGVGQAAAVAPGAPPISEYSRMRVERAASEGLRVIRLVLRWGIELRLGGLRKRDVEAALGEDGELLEIRPMLDEVGPLDAIDAVNGDVRFEVLGVTARSDEEISDVLGVGRASLSTVGPAPGESVGSASAPACPPAALLEEPTAATEAVEAPSAAKEGGVAADPARTAARRGGIVRVDLSRLEALVELTGEIVTARTRLQELSARLTAAHRRDESVRELHVAVKEAGALVDSLQDMVMGLRMVPVGQAFAKLPRIMRDLNRSCGKEIRLELAGEETELDKRVIEQIEEPLLHLLRNACDHGIESPDERSAAGKDRVGTIAVSARQEGSDVVLECADDGRGLDVARILATALEQGVIGEGEEPTPHVIADIIAAPGFTTSETVTDVSGRGVGLDVVGRRMKELGGEFEVVSEPGAGTRFIMRIPLTLAIIPALVVSANGRVLALPLAVVSGVLRAAAREIRVVHGREVLDLRGETVPVLRLSDVLRLGPGSRASRHFIVEVSVRGKKAGLLVDRLLGRQEIVVKSLEEAVGATPGVSGATILGDGSIVPILDVDGMVRLREESLKEESMSGVGGER